jgi:Zn-dependent protease with chaperone function
MTLFRPFGTLSFVGRGPENFCSHLPVDQACTSRYRLRRAHTRILEFRLGSAQTDTHPIDMDAFAADHLGIWAIPAYFAGAFGVTYLSNSFAIMSWRRARNQHWTEQARRIYPARVSATFNVLLIAGFAGAHEAFASDKGTAFAVACGAAALAGALLGGYGLDRTIYSMLTFRTWCGMVSGWWLLRSAYWGMLIVGGLLMPANFGPVALGIGLAVFAIYVAFLAGTGLKLAQWLGIVVEPSAEIRRIVEEVTEPAGISPRTLILRTPMANAFALPHLQRLLLTSRLLEELSPAELASVIRHELGHLTESRRVVWARLLASTSVLPFIFIRPIAVQFGPAGVITLACALWLVKIQIQNLARRMEVRADALAVADTGAGTFASALEHIYRINLIPAVMPGKRQHHPHLYDRLTGAGITPEFERPKPPSKIGWSTSLIIGAILAYAFAFAFRQ